MWVGGIMSGIGAAVAGVGGAFASGAAAVAFGIGGLAVGAAAVGFLAGVGSFGGLAMLGYRRLYRYALRRGERAIRDLLGSIAVDIDTEADCDAARARFDEWRDHQARRAAELARGDCAVPPATRTESP